MIKVFISHSKHDEPLVVALIELIRNALSLEHSDIRCTSVNGYRLPGGTDIDEQLRIEVAESDVFLAVLSKMSLRSSYVLFELGARWGLKKRLFPLLAPGLEPSDLEGPIASLNALQCDSQPQMLQLVEELSGKLNKKMASPAFFHSYLDKLCSVQPNSHPDGPARIQRTSTHSSNEDVSQNARNLSEEEIVRAATIIAEKDYPNDFTTQNYVINQQVEAWEKLRGYSDPYVPQELVGEIISDAEQKYPSDYSTQLYVVKEQISAWKKIKHI